MSENTVADTKGLRILAALLAAQAETPKVAKNAINPHFRNKYATLDAIWDAVSPTLLKAGLLTTNYLNGEEVVTRIYEAKSGEYVESRFPVPASLLASPQQIGSVLTYARRYNLCALLQISTGEDDDGNAASTPARQKPSETAARVAPDFSKSPFGNHKRWSEMTDEQLKSAAAYVHEKMTDGHRAAINAELEKRKASAGK